MKLDNLTSDEKFVAFKQFADNTPKGIYVRAKWQSEKKVRKSYSKDNPDTKVIKVSEGLVRIGIDYHNTEVYKNKEIKDCTYTAPLYETRVDGYGDYMTMVAKPGEPTYYKVKLFASKSANHKVESKYYLNGIETPKDELVDIITKEPTRDSDEFIMFTVRLDNLLEIGTN